MLGKLADVISEREGILTGLGVRSRCCRGRACRTASAG
jgi:hypothetical protein